MNENGTHNIKLAGIDYSKSKLGFIDKNKTRFSDHEQAFLVIELSGRPSAEWVRLYEKLEKHAGFQGYWNSLLQPRLKRVHLLCANKNLSLVVEWFCKFIEEVNDKCENAGDEQQATTMTPPNTLDAEYSGKVKDYLENTGVMRFFKG
ncbi:hypothetical protein EXT60_20890 [Pectobacterium carotovorum subsp. carotovorum]|nr:hypothetical protein [Pectobacterium carotovorum]MCL6366676.1 hypothetical protein [Pectobacterium carotovorum subsp. carotovorum]